MVLADLHFFLRPIIGLSLVALTVAIHAAGATGIYKLAVQKWLTTIARPPRLRPVIWLIVRFTWLLIVLHMMEILLWGVFFFVSAYGQRLVAPAGLRGDGRARRGRRGAGAAAAGHRGRPGQLRRRPPLHQHGVQLHHSDRGLVIGLRVESSEPLADEIHLLCRFLR